MIDVLQMSLTPLVKHRQTILVAVIDDHGMDYKGECGNSDFEVESAGPWVYSKGPSLSSPSITTSQHKAFPGEPTSHRSVQQVKPLPTLLLFLGLHSQKLVIATSAH
ncbi:hypothetical protein EI94DRAFT_528199 [Lactarius quietus]|nr:hypothetical protein EI94DRAFT_528199 [Lactarius quietus]